MPAIAMRAFAQQSFKATLGANAGAGIPKHTLCIVSVLGARQAT